jgi:tRNA G18 (ribose-2'-O)-methylase SpoU
MFCLWHNAWQTSIITVVMSFDENIDEDLIADGDSRNVVDRYRNWKVSAIKADLAKNAFPLHVAIENFQHDINIGSIVRSANAFNVAGVHIIGKRRWNRRGAMATEKYLQLYHHDSPVTFTDWAKEQGMTVIGIDNIPTSTPLSSAKLPAHTVYVFGQEGPGLSAEMQAACQDIIAIEQFGSTRSVNVGVAAGIVLYEWTRRNRLSDTNN